MSMQPGLYMVATPIGNLGDLSDRAREILKVADVVCAEDTRVTGLLVRNAGGQGELWSYREAMGTPRAAAMCERVASAVQEGKVVAYCSDAGTPGVSDPGSALVAAVRASGGLVVPIPGPSALTALLSVSGLAIERPLFAGFLPHKKGRQTATKKLLGALADDICDAVVLFESPHRLVKFLEEVVIQRPGAQVVVGRELTKKFEEVLAGSVEEVVRMLDKRAAVKGECVVLIV